MLRTSLVAYQDPCLPTAAAALCFAQSTAASTMGSLFSRKSRPAVSQQDIAVLVR